MAEKKHILIICGEPSGDLNASNLAKEILKINPGTKISAVGGARLRNAGASIYYDIKELSVMGLWDVIKKLPKFFSLKKFILHKIKEEKHDAVILVDFSGFNLRLAKAINKTVPVIYYVCPQVWASRSGRIRAMKKYISKLVVIFKFEQEFYKRFGVDTDFVGHPLLDTAFPMTNRREFLVKYSLSSSKTTIALLPGSRKAEIEHILPVMLETSKLLKEKIPEVQFIVAKSANVDLETYFNKIKNTDLDLKIIEDKTYDCINSSDFCLVCSGTATLETAIMQKPFCIIYKMNLLNYLLYRPQIKVPYIGIVNLVAGKRIVPEFIQHKARPEDIAAGVLRLIEDKPGIEKMREELVKVKSLLGEKGASNRAAAIIMGFLKESRE